jgi:hypothetical protein
MCDDERESEMMAAFAITGRDFNPDICSIRIGREPTLIWRQKRPDLAARTDLANAAWIVRTEWSRDDSVDDAVRTLLEEIWPYRDAIIACAQEFALSVSVECSIEIWSSPPHYNLTAETMRRLSQLNAEFALDLYDYRESEEKENKENEA